jgi:hypothetical protein
MLNGALACVTLPVSMPAQALARFSNRIVNALSFGAEYQKMRRLLNLRIDSPAAIEDFPPSHPAGFVRELKKRRITIVESYLIIIRSLESEHHKERIKALGLLEEQTFHSKNITMPLNTARVQIALMKEAIKSRDNKRRQLELLHDFTVSSYGQPSVIRRFLDEMGIIELPETGTRIADMKAGWDLHVHDNTSYGRKTPSQLVIDAFIKGISEITVAFDQLDNLGNIEEVLEAGAILGIRVNIGVEFSVRTCGHRFHFMFLLPFLRTSAELPVFLRSHETVLRAFLEDLDRNRNGRVRSVRALIDNFNAVFLPALNEGYPRDSVYSLGALDLAQAEEIVPLANVNRLLMGEILYAAWKPVLLRRVLLARSMLTQARIELDRGSISQGDYTNMASRSQGLREAYTELNPEDLRARYFTAPSLADYPTTFTDMAAVCGPLRSTGGTIKILHPLEHGLDAACEVILANSRWLDSVEIHNMYDGIERSVDDILRFARFLNALNSGLADSVKPFLAGRGISLPDGELARIAASVGAKPLVPVCGSDSTGRSTTIPGMGFIFSSRVSGRYRRRYLDRHFALPGFVSRIIAAEGSSVDEEKVSRDPDAIISMGKSTHFTPNKIGDETDVTPIPFLDALRYLNPGLLNLLFIGAGFLVATVTIGGQYALVWFGITTLRHVIVDLVARRGYRMREWSLREVDYRNVARSLFWTGISVPLLAFVKHAFDQVWPLPATGHLYQFSKYFFIALVNGLYLMTHNRLRGFEKGVTAANFFRALLSWPFASLSAPLLDLLFVPSIVQAKAWSDMVGGVIEGSGKFIRSVGLTRRDLSDILPAACAEEETRRNTAILDLLYIFGRETRARNSLREILFGRRNLLERTGDVLRGRPTRAEPRAEEYRILSAWFGHAGNYQKLSDFVIAHYSQEWAILLIDLLSRQYFRFHEWLVREGRFLPGPDRGRAAS